MSEKRIYPRALAVRIITRVLSDHEPLDEVMNQRVVGLPPASIAWLQDICSGTLRWKGRLDLVIDAVALKKKPSGWLRKCLLLAAYQLIVQDRVHAGAVVSETVSEIKSKEGEAPARFANACLRKISAHVQAWKNPPFPSDDSTAVQAAWASLPEWLWLRLVHDHGLAWAQAYAEASLERPKLWIRSRADDTRVAQAKNQMIAGPVEGSWQVSEGGPVTQWDGFSEGKFIVQDISSQLLIAETVKMIRDARGSQAEPLEAIDLCAAPGGKSVGMAWSGVQVVATDRSETRYSLLQQTVTRTNSDVRLVPWEQVAEGGPKEWVWLDAPCSGTGILRRHPDVRWLREEKEIQGLRKTQEELLKKALTLVKPSGFLVYSVCSVLKDEGPRLIERMGLKDRVLKTWSLAPQEAPHGDGFWAVLLKP